MSIFHCCFDFNFSDELWWRETLIYVFEKNKLILILITMNYFTKILVNKLKNYNIPAPNPFSVSTISTNVSSFPPGPIPTYVVCTYVTFFCLHHWTNGSFSDLCLSATSHGMLSTSFSVLNFYFLWTLLFFYYAYLYELIIHLFLSLWLTSPCRIQSSSIK